MAQGETTEGKTMNIKDKTVYLSGKITGDPDFKHKFLGWESIVIDMGASKVRNPARLPDGWDYDEYMEHCMIMVRRCDLVAVLPDWEDSKGARAEVAYALSLGKPVKRLVGGLDV